jgi:hypothetical protein
MAMRDGQGWAERYGPFEPLSLLLPCWSPSSLWLQTKKLEAN